jgi:hypothetical protein
MLVRSFEVRDACAPRDLKGEIVLVLDRMAEVAADAATVGAALDQETISF